ncbi:MAG: hypothetical protein ACKN81_00485 [Pirellulaceae bacterium]
MSRRRPSAPGISFFAFQDIITSVVGIFVLLTLILVLELATRVASAQRVQQSFEDIFSDQIASLEQELKQLSERSNFLDQQESLPGSKSLANREAAFEEMKTAIQMLQDQARRLEVENEKIEELLGQQEVAYQQLQVEMQKRVPEKEELNRLLGKLKQLDSKIQELETESPLIFRDQDLQGRTVVILEIGETGVQALDLSADRRFTFAQPGAAAKVAAWIDGQKSRRLHFFLLVRPNSATLFNELRDALKSSSRSFGYDVVDPSRVVKLRSEVSSQ